MTILRNSAGDIWAISDGKSTDPSLTVVYNNRVTGELHAQIVNGQHSFWVPGRNRENRIATMEQTGYRKLSRFSVEYMEWLDRIEKHLVWQAIAQ